MSLTFLKQRNLSPDIPVRRCSRAPAWNVALSLAETDFFGTDGADGCGFFSCIGSGSRLAFRVPRHGRSPRLSRRELAGEFLRIVSHCLAFDAHRRFAKVGEEKNAEGTNPVTYTSIAADETGSSIQRNRSRARRVLKGAAGSRTRITNHDESRACLRP